MTRYEPNKSTSVRLADKNNQRSQMKRLLTPLLLIVTLTGCNSQLPKGADFWTTDFVNYDKNFSEFPTEKLEIDMPFNIVTNTIGLKYRTIKKGKNLKVIEYDRWKSKYPVDYRKWTLEITFINELLSAWEIKEHPFPRR